MTSDEVNRYNIQQQYSRATKPPVTFGSDADVANFVNNTPGAIGYVSSGTTLPSGVKVVLKVN